MAKKKNSRQDNPRETVYLTPVTREQLTLLLNKYPRRSKSDMMNAAIEHLYLSGYETGLDGNLLPINPKVYSKKDISGSGNVEKQ